MRNTFKYALLLIGMTSLPAMAHIGYSGRDFGIFTGTAGETQTRSNNAVTGNFGWIDGTDTDWGDSHNLRAYSFHLDNDADVKIAFQAQIYTPAPTSTVPSPVPVEGTINPGFSLFSGLAHLAPFTADFDSTPGSIAIRDAVGGVGLTEGSFRALTDWSITNAENDPASVFTYIGSAYDGSNIDYGTGVIPGADGLADHMVSQVFHLTAGDYSIFVGGTDYLSQTGTPPFLKYGIEGMVSVVPEPETYAMLLAGLGLLGFSARRRHAV